MKLSCSKKSISIIKKSNIKTCLYFVLFALYLFVYNKKTLKVYENKDFLGVVMPCKDTKILQFNQQQKSDKRPFIIYIIHIIYYLESLIKRREGRKNSFEKSSTAKVGEHNPFGCSISTVWTFDGIKIIMYTKVKMT